MTDLDDKTKITTGGELSVCRSYTNMINHNVSNLHDKLLKQRNDNGSQNLKNIKFN